MKRGEAWGIVAIAASGALSIALSWNRWLDPVIDAGRDLYVPVQLAHGAHLYRDVAYNYPPLAPYALAALVRLFGSSLALYVAIGVVLAAGCASAIYLFARRIAGVEAAFTATLLFTTLCVAGRPNFNFFFPYAHSMTFGAAFAMAFLASSWWIWGVLACATKVEFAAVVIAYAAVTKRWLAAALFAAIAFAVTPFPAKLMHGASGFYARLARGDWRQILAGVVILGGVAMLSTVPRAIWIAPLFVLIPADDLLSAAPAVHLALLPLLRKRMGLFPLWCASVVSTARIPMNVNASYNGFAYVLPTILLFVCAAFTLFPKTLWMALFIGVSLHALWRPREPVVRVDTAHGDFFDRDLSRGRVLNEIVAFLARGAPLSPEAMAVQQPTQETLAVLPEGVSINYFTGRRTPLRTYLFTPPEFDESATRDFAAHPPDLVLFVPRALPEYGSRGFGVDYAQSLAGLIATRYRHVRTFRHGYYVAELWRRR
ncbi:MAG: hypothetical protein ABIP63_01055 [Thermoanaerobaculia bacterium]